MRALFASCLAVLVCHAAALAQEAPTQEEISKWIARLKDKDAGMRQAAANALKQFQIKATNGKAPAKALAQFALKSRKAVPALALALKDDNPDVRAAAAEALLALVHPSFPPEESIVPALITALKDPDARVCRYVAPTLAYLPVDKSVVRALIEVTTHPNEEVRNAAVHAIWIIAPCAEAEAAIPALIHALKEPRNSYPAAWALGRFGPKAKAAIPALALLLKDNSSSNRSAAALALSMMGAEARGVVPALAEALKDKEDVNVVANAARTLGMIGPDAKAAAPALLETIGKDKDSYVRLHAAEALVKIGEHKTEAFAALVSLLKNKKDEEINYNHYPALAVLVRLGAEVKTTSELKVVVPALEKLLKEKKGKKDA